MFPSLLHFSEKSCILYGYRDREVQEGETYAAGQENTQGHRRQPQGAVRRFPYLLSNHRFFHRPYQDDLGE